MTSFDYRKVFRVTGNVPGMTNGFREFTGGGGGQPTPGKPIGIEGATPDLSGQVGQPTSALCAKEKKIKRERKKKEEVGRKGDSLPPNLVQLGLGGESPPPWTRPTPLGLLEPQGKVPPLPPIYTEVLGLI